MMLLLHDLASTAEGGERLPAPAQLGEVDQTTEGDTFGKGRKPAYGFLISERETGPRYPHPRLNEIRFEEPGF